MLIAVMILCSTAAERMAGFDMENHLNNQITVKNNNSAQPSLEKRIACATYIAVRGACESGIATKRPLMYPHQGFTENDVENAAAKVLTRLHIELLKALPPEAIQRISTDLDEHLSFVLGD